MRQSKGCSIPAPRSTAAKQWFEELAQKKKNEKGAVEKQRRDQRVQHL